MLGPSRLAAGLVFAFLCCGCALPNSAGGYFENRRQDLIDLAHVDLGAVNVGAVAYAAPFMLGLDYQTGTASREHSSTLQIGLGGPRLLGRKGLAAGIIWPASRWDEDKPFIGKRPKRSPSGLSAGVSAGVLLGIGAEADVLEALDFVLGILCIDIVEDDANVRKPDLKPVEDIIAPAAKAAAAAAAAQAGQ